MHQPSRPQTAPPEDARVAAPRGGLGDLDLDSTFSGGAYFRFLSDTMDKGATHSPQKAVPPRPSTATGWSSAHAIGADQMSQQPTLQRLQSAVQPLAPSVSSVPMNLLDELAKLALCNDHASSAPPYLVSANSGASLANQALPSHGVAPPPSCSHGSKLYGANAGSLQHHDSPVATALRQQIGTAQLGLPQLGQPPQANASSALAQASISQPSVQTSTTFSPAPLPLPAPTLPTPSTQTPDINSNLTNPTMTATITAATSQGGSSPPPVSQGLLASASQRSLQQPAPSALLPPMAMPSASVPGVASHSGMMPNLGIGGVPSLAQPGGLQTLAPVGMQASPLTMCGGMAGLPQMQAQLQMMQQMQATGLPGGAQQIPVGQMPVLSAGQVGVGLPNVGLNANGQVGLPTVMMASVNGVAQPVVLMPQFGVQGQFTTVQYGVQPGVSSMPAAFSPGVTVGGLAMGVVNPQSHYGSDKRVNGGGSSDRGRGREKREGGGGGGVDGGSGGAPKKPLMCHGREVRTVEEAAALDCILELAHDQNGCRFLQDQLDLRTKLHVDLVFEAVLQAVVALSMDPFGNYLIQKLLQYGESVQRTRLVHTAAPSIMEIAVNVHGTRVVQKMVEACDSDEQADLIVAAIEPQAMDLVRDMNGNHVIQRLLAVMGNQRASFVYDLVQRECLAVSMHRHGCCVMQRSLDHADSTIRAAIIEQVIRHARQLVCDPFGNYVVQYVLDLKQASLTLRVIQSLHGAVAELSLQKFSSNVIEKCLTCGDRKVIGLIAAELQTTNSFGTLLHDPFANYVIQTLLTVGSDEEVSMLLAKIQPYMATLRSTLYGKRIQAKLLRRFPQLRTV